ncbi:hypothetical protein N665_0061s0010 [Sinapis alba]|nr:hypothetical protein N665_0061s0010 [Sinapis alba]
MIPRPTSEDLAELNDNERSVVQFNLELEEREETGQVAVDDVVQKTEPRSTPQNNPSADADSVARDKASAEKVISLALADLLPMRWSGNDFEFDEEIDPEKERCLSVKKNQKWENHFPTRSMFKSVHRLILLTNPPQVLVPRPGGPPKTVDSSCRIRLPLGQYTANGIRILVILNVLAAELGINMSVHLFEDLTTPSITVKTGFFYGKMVPKYNVITGKPSKVNFWNRAYFYVKINEASFEDPAVILNGYFNANIDRLSKWLQGGSRSFLEEVEAIRTLSYQHWPDITEARIQAALNRINRAEIATERNRNQRMGKLNLASLPSYANTIGTLVHGRDSSGDEEHLGDDGREPEVQEIPSSEPFVEAEVAITNEVLAEEHPVDLQSGEEPQGDQLQDPDQTAHGDEVVEYPHLIDFKYQHTDVPFVKDHEAPARLFRQIKQKKKGMPELEQLWQNSRYREMTRAGVIDEKLALKTDSLKRKSKEIAELAYKCGAYEEQHGTLEAENNEAVERVELERSRNELLSKELEEQKAQNEGLDTRCRNLEQEKAEQGAPVYEKVRQFIDEQPLIQFKLALYSQAKGTREGLEKIQTQGLSIDKVLQQARADEAKYQEELQGMEVVEASEIDLVPIGLDEHRSNMTAFSPQDIEDLRS